MAEGIECCKICTNIAVHSLRFCDVHAKYWLKSAERAQIDWSDNESYEAAVSLFSRGFINREENKEDEEM